MKRIKLLARVMVVMFAITLVIGTSTVCVFADEVTSDAKSLTEAITNAQKEGTTAEVQPDTAAEDKFGDIVDNAALTDTQSNLVDKFDKAFKNADKTDPKIDAAGEKIASLAGKATTIITYVVLGLLIVSRALDIAFIAIPFIQPFLANGYVGTPDMSNGDQLANSANGAMGPAGGGMGAMGGMGGYGMGGYGMGGLGGSRYGMGAMGAMSGYGAANGVGMANSMQNQPAHGRFKWVSDEALNAQATAATGIGKKAAIVLYLKKTIISSSIIIAALILNVAGLFNNLGMALAKIFI